MLNNILKIQENRTWAKNVVRFFKNGVFFQNLCNILLKSLDQRKYYIAVFASNI